MGGNVFKNQDGQAATQRINQTDVKPTLAWLEQMLDMDLQNNTLGSTGLKPTSGDLDVAIDSSEITPAQLKAELAQWVTANKGRPEDYIKATGSGVHFRTPINGSPRNGFVQTDFMFMKNMGIGKFFLTAPADSKYKGQDRNVLVNSIAKALGYKLSQREGILDRATDKVVSADPDEIAKLLLNKSATKDDLYSVETIVKALEKDPKKDAKLADARTHFKNLGVPFFEGIDTPYSEVNYMARLRDRIVNQGMVPLVENQRLTEASAARIEHLEDLVFDRGSAGISQALDIVAQGAENTAKTTTVKWDGKPAIIWGRKPTGEFVLTDKAGFHAKGYDGMATSPEALARMITARGPDRGELVAIYDKLFPLLQAATPEGFKGFLKGDLLYTEQPPEESGAFVFKPNTVEYKIPAASALGQRIGNSQVGIAVHTYIGEQNGEEKPVGGNLGMNEVPGLLLIEPTVKDIKNVAPENKMLKQLRALNASKGKAIDQLFNPADLRTNQITDLPALCKKYINSRINTNFQNLLPDFGAWLQTNVTPKKYNNIVEYLQSPRSNMDGISAAFTAFLGLHDLKMDMLNQLDRQQPGQEGWVMATDAGRAKLVNRFGFSAANRAQNNPNPQA
jgi:hypothetical protein